MRKTARDAILDAAERMLVTFGYQKMTMEDIAQEAGVGRTTVYLHFRTKEEVGLASLDRIHERLMDHLTRIAGSDGVAIGERVRRMLVGRVLFAFDDTARRPRAADDDAMFRAIRETYLLRREQYLANEAALFADLVDAGLAAGEFRIAPHRTAREVGQALVLATNALLPFSAGPRPESARGEVEGRTECIAELLVSGLRAGS